MYANNTDSQLRPRPRPNDVLPKICEFKILLLYIYTHIYIIQHKNKKQILSLKILSLFKILQFAMRT